MAMPPKISRAGTLSPSQKTTAFRDEVAVPVIAQEEGANVLPSEQLGTSLVPQVQAEGVQYVPQMPTLEEEESSIELPTVAEMPVLEQQELLDIQQARQEFTQPVPLQDLVSREGAIATTDNINKRLEDIYNAVESNQAVKKGDIEENSMTVENKLREVNKGQISDLFQRSNSLAEDFNNPQNIVMTNPNTKEEVDAFSLLKVVMGQNVDTETQSLSLLVSMFQEVSDINAMRLMNQDKSAAVTDAYDLESTVQANRYDIDEETQVAGNLEGTDIGAIKSQVNPDDSNSYDIDQYKFINNTARRLVQRAKEMLGGQAVEMDENDSNDVELGEYLLQRAIDDGEIGIYSFTDPRSKKKYFYPQVMPKGETFAKTTQDIAVASNPSNDLINISRTVPTNHQGKLGDMKFDAKKGTVLKADGTEISPSEAVLSLNGGVGRVVDEDILTIVEQLYSMGDGKYFKNDDASYKETFNEALIKARAKYTNLGVEPERAERRANADAKRTADLARKTKDQKTKNDLMLMKQRLQDVDGNGEQLIKFAEWGVSQINNRIQEVSRDMQSDSKAVIRAVDNFAEKAYVKVKPRNQGESRKQANLLKEILMLSKSQMRNGEKALERFNSLDEGTKNEMAMKAMWAGTFIKLEGATAPEYEYTNTSGKMKPNTKRMNPAQLLEYYSQNEETIIKTLASYGRQVKGWVKNPQSIPTPENRQGWQQEVLKRGELGYFVSNLIDASNYASSPVGTNLRLKGMYEIDANNSNVAIQTLKTGNIINAATLGFIVDPQDPDAWYDTMKNPDSFYTILSENLGNVIQRSFNDTDKQEALSNFVNALINKGKGKDLTRDSVVAGFYGLHPNVNIGSIRSILTQFAKEAQTHLVENGPYKNAMGSDLMNDLLAMQGANYNQILQNISISKTVKQIGSIISLIGDYDPAIKTDLGDIIKSHVGELMPEYMQDMVMEEVSGGRLLARKPLETFVDSKGYTVPMFRVGKRLDDRKEKFTVDADGNLKDIHKEHGARFMDGLAAIITHTQDAALEKLAIMSQNVGRKLSSPNISIHDANKLNAKSYIQHWISYNMIALPSLASQTDTYSNLLKVADDVVDQLSQIIKTAKKEGKNIPVGTSNSQHRSMFNILDYHYKNNKDPIDKTRYPTMEQYRKAVDKRKRTLLILKDAADNGWIPNDPENKTYQKVLEQYGEDTNVQDIRRNASVTPEQFDKILKSVLRLQGYLAEEGQIRPPLFRKIQEWKKNAEAVIDSLKKGKFLSNAQN